MAGSRRACTIRIDSALNAMTYSIGLVSFISVIRYIDPAFSAAFAGLFALAAWFDYRRRITISRTVLNLALVMFVFLNALRISIDNIAAPLVEMLLILMAVKFIEEKKPRDYMQIYTLSVFLLTGSALLSLDIQFLVIVFILAFMLPVGSVLLTFYSQKSEMNLARPDLASIFSRALLITVASIPLAAFLFVVLPRTGYPLLNFLNRTGASAGFTDNVRLGEVSSIQENASVMLRVDTAKIDNEALYWRGIVLDYFDGVSWRSTGRTGEGKERAALQGRRVMQTIYLEPYESRYLFALDKPITVSYRFASINTDFEIVSRRNIGNRIKYNVMSSLSASIGVEKTDRVRYLQLPSIDFSRTIETVKKLQVLSSDEKTAAAILGYLKYGAFSYSVNNLPVTRTPIEDFLFKYKYGNCEYFASAMAVMLRLAGIPARLVGGYTGGNYNDFGGYYIVAQDRAHVWVEAFLEGRGWVRMDPTPGSSGIPGRPQQGAIVKIKMLLDSINYYWNAMVIGYDFNKQITLFTDLSMALKYPALNPAVFKKLLLNSALILTLITALCLVCYRLAKIRTADKRIIADFLMILKRYGYVRKECEGLEEFAIRISEPLLKEKAMRFVAEFQGIYYRDRRMGRDEIARLRRLLDELRQ
jgi:protein-glutamine gamma-glutamyltransferase